MKKKISTNNTLRIREYMNYYLEVPYLKEESLTHDKMKDYLEEKGYPIPRPIAFSKITTEDILTGTYLLVREETKGRKDTAKKARILAYKNPLRENVEALIENNIQKTSTTGKVYTK